jgi:hypothetical protein
MSDIDTASIRKSFPGGKPKTALFQIWTSTALIVWILDLVAKAMPRGGWWTTHYIHRSVGYIVMCAVVTALCVAAIPWRSMAIGAGLFVGGACANVTDSLDGVVLNMIPIPFTDGFTCNVADFGIMGGFALMLAAGLARCRHIT